MRKFLSILMLACLLCGMVLPVAAEGETAQLYAKVGDGTDYQTSLSFQAGNTLTARFYTASAEDSVAIATLTGSPGLTVTGPDSENNFSLTSERAGNYSVSCVQSETTYSMTITVTTNTITVPNAEKLGEVLSAQDKFDAFLAENYYGDGDLILQLPAGDLGNVTCNVQLPGDATLALKGASGTKMTGLTIQTENVCVDGITFTGSPSIKVNTLSGCRVSNSTFLGSGSAFKLLQDGNGKVAPLTLTKNTFSNVDLVTIANSSDTVTGKWLGSTRYNPETGTIDFGVKIDRGQEKTLKITVLGDKKDLVSNDWHFEFKTDCNFEDAYVVYDGQNITSSLKDGKIQMVALQVGDYTVVNGSGPEVVKKDATTKTMTISAEQSEYLRKVTVPCDFKAVKVTDSKGKAVDWKLDSDGNLTITLTGNSPYTIKEVSTTKTVTTTTTKTTTTRRKYTTNQDCFLVTPAGFTNAMRCVKDNLVTLNCTEAGSKSISLPAASMAAAAEKGYDVLVKTKNAELTLDAAALKSLAQQAKGATVLLHYESLNHKTLTTVGQASVQSHLAQYPNDSADLAFLVTATSDAETIEDLQKGTITLKIPFIVLPGTEEYDNVVYALQGEGVSEARETTVADGYLTTKLQDLTEHMVFQVGEPVETTEETTEPETTVETTQPETEPVTKATQPPEPEETDRGFPMWISVAAVLLLAGGGAAAYFLIVRKRMKQ